MNVLDENGNVVLTPKGFPKQIARTNQDPKPYPICGASNGQGFPCGNIAGRGTSHHGFGRCYMHGGRMQEMGHGQLKYSITANVSYPGIQEEVERLRADKDVFDLREHIFLMEAIAKTVLNQAKTVEDLGPVMKYVEMASKTIQRLDEIEHGRRLVIDIQGLNVIFAKVTECIFRYVPDTYTRDLIARDIGSIPINRTRLADKSDSVDGTVVEGVAVEDRSPVGAEDQV